MTLERLNQHLDLLQHRTQTEELLVALRSRAEPGSKAITGMPHGSGISDRVGDLAAEIVDCENAIEQLTEQIKKDEIPIVKFIGSIPNLQTRTIFRLRFLRGLSWKEVSQILGRYTTESNVKSVCYRFFQRQGSKDVG